MAKPITQRGKNQALALADEFNGATATLEEYVRSSDFEILVGLARSIEPEIATALEQEAQEIFELNQRVYELVELIEVAGAKRKVRT